MCCVVSGQIGVRRLHPKTAEHSNNLPAMKGSVVNRVKHDLPAWHLEYAVVRQDSRDLTGQIIVRGGFKPLAIALPKFGPGLNQKLKRMFWSATARQTIAAHFNQSKKPDTLPIMNMAEGL